MKLVPKAIVDELLDEAAAVGATPEDQQMLALKMQDFQEKLSGAFDAVLNDKEWRSCYQRLHTKALFERRMEAIEEIMNGLDSDLTSSAIIILLGAALCSSFRVSWLLVASIGWLIVGFIRFGALMYRLRDPWTTLNQQIEALAAKE